MEYEFFSSLLVKTPLFSYSDYGQIDYTELLRNRYFKIILCAADPVMYDSICRTNFAFDALDTEQQHIIKCYINRAFFNAGSSENFSCVSLSEWKDKANGILFHSPVLETIIQLDHFSSLALCEKLAQQEANNFVLYKPNPSLHKVLRYYRYIKKEPGVKLHQHYFSFVSLPLNKLIGKVLAFCSEGKSREEITAFLETPPGLSCTEAYQFTDQLIGKQIILAQPGKNTNGDTELIEMIRLLQHSNIHSEKMEKIKAVCEKLNTGGSNRLNDIVESARLLRELLPGRQEPAGRFYAATERETAEGGLSVRYQRAILDGLYCIDKLVPGRKAAAMENFKRQMVKKFENREIPLLMALDPETGVGYKNYNDVYVMDSLFEGIEFGQQVSHKEKKIKWTSGHAFLLNKLIQQKIKGDTYILELTEEEIDALERPDQCFQLPPTISVVFRIIDNNVFIESAGGVSAIPLIGSSISYNESSKTIVNEIAGKEEGTNKQVFFAEIPCLNDSGTVAFNRAPKIRNFEILILPLPAADEPVQIPLHDLYVKVTADSQVILLSKQLNSRIVPRMSTVLSNDRNDFSVFSFLADLQYEGLKTNFKLDLTTFYPGLEFYPRVVYKSAVLSLATWQLNAKSIDILKNSTGDNRYTAFLELATAIRLSRYFTWVQKEHTLVIDTGNAADVELFLDTIKNESNILLEEFIIDKDCYITTGEGLQQKPLAGQFIASLYQNREIYAPGSSTETEKNSYGQRDILRSTGGLYYKIYCAPHSSCELLRTSIMELVSVLLKTKLIYQWSFARNEDPDHHIRFRLHCRDTRMNEVTAMVGYRLQQEVEKRQVDKYYREKYVREMISYTDSIDKEVEYFCFRSSDMVLHHLKKYAGTDATTANYNLDFIILSVGELFNAFGLAMDERIAQLQNLYEGFFKKLGASSELMISLEKKYDSLREEIAMICKNISKVKKKYGDLELNFFESSRLLADKIRKSNYPFAQRMISDLLQAHLSRLFYSGSEKYELVVFYLLYRHNTGIYFNEKSTAG